MIEWQTKRCRPWLRLAAGFTIIFFSVTNLGLADVSAVLASRSPDLLKAPPSSNNSVSSSTLRNFFIPEDLGQIKRSFQGKRDKILIHIQDAHANEEAQRHIAKIIDYFASEHGLKWVGLEGAEGELYTELLSLFPDQDVRRSVSDYYLRQARMSGAEYEAIVERPELRLFGVEEEALYEKNRKAYLSSLEGQEKDEKVLNEIGRLLHGLSRFVFSEDIRRLMKQRLQFNDGGEDLSAYVGLLVRMAKTQNMPLDEYPHMHSLLSLIDLENEIDFDAAGRQIDLLIGDLKKTISRDRLSRFLTNTIQFRMKKMKRGDYYGYLENEIKETAGPQGAGALKEKYQHVLDYLHYIRIYDSIGLEIFDEINRLEVALKSKLFRSPEEVELDRVLKIFEIYQNLFNFTLTKQDADLFFASRSDFQTTTFSRFLPSLLKKYHFSDGLPPDLEILDRDLGRIERFYETAVGRDQILIRNAVEKMDKEKTSISVLITGGFHTPGIESYLRQQDYSYVVIAPRIAGKFDRSHEETLYQAALARKPMPIEQKLLAAFRPPTSGILKDPRFQLAARPLTPPKGEGAFSLLSPSPKWGTLFAAAFQLFVGLSLLKTPDAAGQLLESVPAALPEGDQLAVRREIRRSSALSVIRQGAAGTRYLFLPDTGGSKKVWAMAVGPGKNLPISANELGLRSVPAEQLALGKNGVVLVTRADPDKLAFSDLQAELDRKRAGYAPLPSLETSAPAAARSEVRGQKRKPKQTYGPTLTRREFLQTATLATTAVVVSGVRGTAQEKSPLAGETYFKPAETARQLKTPFFGDYQARIKNLQTEPHEPQRIVRLGDYPDGIFGRAPYAFQGSYHQGGMNYSGPVAPYATALAGQVIPQEALTALRVLSDSSRFPGAFDGAGFTSAVDLEQPRRFSEDMLTDDKSFTIAALANRVLPAGAGTGYLQFLYQSIPSVRQGIETARTALRADAGPYKNLPDPDFYQEKGRLSFDAELSSDERTALSAIMKAEWNYFRTLTAPIHEGGDYRIPANYADHGLSEEADYFGITGSLGGYLRAILAMEKLGAGNGGISPEEASARVQALVREMTKLKKHKGFFFHSYRFTGNPAAPYAPAESEGSREVPALDNKWVESGLRMVLAAAKNASLTFNLPNAVIDQINGILHEMDFADIFYDRREHAFYGNLKIDAKGKATASSWHYQSFASEFRHHLISELGHLGPVEARAALTKALAGTRTQSRKLRLELSDRRVGESFKEFLEDTDAQKNFQTFIARLRLLASAVSNEDKHYWLTYLAQKEIEGDPAAAALLKKFRRILKEREGLSFEAVTAQEKDRTVLKETFFQEEIFYLSGVYAKDDALEQFGSIVDLNETVLFPETLGRAAKSAAYAQKMIAGHRPAFYQADNAGFAGDPIDEFYNREMSYLDSQKKTDSAKDEKLENDAREEIWRKLFEAKSGYEAKGIQGQREFILTAFSQLILPDSVLMVRKKAEDALRLSDSSDLLNLANPGGLLDQYFDQLQVIPEDLLDEELRSKVSGVSVQNPDEARRLRDAAVHAEVEKYLRTQGIRLTDENREVQIYRAKLRLFWKMAFKGAVTNYFSFFAHIMDENKGGQRYQKMWNRVFGRFETLAREMFIFPETHITYAADIRQDFRYRLTILQGLRQIHSREIARLRAQGIDPGDQIQWMNWINFQTVEARELYDMQLKLYQIQGRFNDVNNPATRMYPAAYDPATGRIRYSEAAEEAKAVKTRENEFSFISVEGYVASLSRDFRAASYAAAPLEQSRNRVELADVINQMNSTFDIQRLSRQGVIRYATEGPEYQRAKDRDMAGFLLMVERSLYKAGKTLDQGALTRWIDHYQDYVRARKLAESTDPAQRDQGQKLLGNYFLNHSGIYEELYSVYGTLPAEVRGKAGQPTAIPDQELAFLAEYKRDDLFQHRTMTWEANIMARGLRKNVAFRYLLESFYAEYMSPVEPGRLLKGSSIVDPENILAKLDRMSFLSPDQVDQFFSPAEQELISKVSMMVMILERIVDRNSVFYEQRNFDVTEVSARTLTWLQQRFWLPRPADAALMQGHELAESLEDFIFGNTAKGQPRVRRFEDLVDGKNFAPDNLGVIHDQDLIRSGKEGGNILAFVFSPDYEKKVRDDGKRAPMARPYGTIVYESTGFIKRAPPIAVRRLRQENPDVELQHIIGDLDRFLTGFPDLKSFLDRQKVKGYERRGNGTTVQDEGLVTLRARIDELAYWTDLEPSLEDLKDASIALTHRTVADNHTLEKYLYRYEQFLETLENYYAHVRFGRPLDVLGADERRTLRSAFDAMTLESFLKYGSFINQADDEYRASPISLAIQDALQEINTILAREKEHGAAAAALPADSKQVTLGNLRGWLSQHDAQLEELERLQAKPEAEKNQADRNRERELAGIKIPEIRNNTLNLLQKTFDLIRLSDEFSIIERNRVLQKIFISMQFVQNLLNGSSREQAQQNALGLIKIYSREESYTAQGVSFNARQFEYDQYTKILEDLGNIENSFRGYRDRYSSRGTEGRELYRIVNQLRFFNELEDYRREPQDEMASYLATHAIQFEVGADPSETRYLVYFGKLLSKVFNTPEDWERWLRTDFYTLLAADVFFRGITSLHETGKIGEGERGNLLQQIQDVTNVAAAQSAMKKSAQIAAPSIAELRRVENDPAGRSRQMQAMKTETRDLGYGRMYAFARERRRNDLINEILTWRRYETTQPFDAMTLGQLLALANQVSGRKPVTNAAEVSAEEERIVRDTEENFMTNFIRKRIGDSIELRAYFRRYQEDMARRVAQRVDAANARKLRRQLRPEEKTQIEKIALLNQSQIEGWISNEFEIDQKRGFGRTFEDFQKILQDRFNLMEDIHFFAIYGLNSFLNFQQLEYIINQYYYNEKGEEFGFPSERLRSRFTGEANVFAPLQWTAEQVQNLIGQNIQQYLPRLDVKLAAPYFSQDPMLRYEGGLGTLFKEAVLLLDATFQTEVDEAIVRFVNEEFARQEREGILLETVDRTNAVVLLAGVYDEMMSRVHFELAVRVREISAEELQTERQRLKVEMLEIARKIFPAILRSVHWGLRDQNHVMGYLNAMELQKRLSSRDTVKYQRVRNRSKVDQAELDIEFAARRLRPVLQGPGTMAEKLSMLAGSDDREKYLQALARYDEIQGERIARARQVLKEKKILPADIEQNQQVAADDPVTRRFSEA